MPFEELSKWKELLTLNEPCAVGFQTSDEFQTLIWQEWLPQVQKACGYTHLIIIYFRLSTYK